jgi:hypothetical protein
LKKALQTSIANLSSKIQAEALNPVSLTMLTTSSVDNCDVVVMTPESFSWLIVALITPGVASRTRVTLPEHPPQVMPVIVKL